jgi:clan AA aspartic protease
MGQTYTEITLKNAGDVGNVRRGLIKESEVREARVEALADTGAITLAITEDVRRTLGLYIEAERNGTFANGTRASCGVTEPVKVVWKNRETSCQAMVVPGATKILLGAIPLEGLDLMVNPVTQELVGAHGDQFIYDIF